jgi:hypothetical protein
MPESLGNTKYILPKGVVCDTCNNYFSNAVEAPVLNHQSFRNIRAKYMVPTKKGKFPYLYGYAFGQDIEIGLQVTKNRKVEIFALKHNRQPEFENLARLNALSNNPAAHFFQCLSIRLRKKCHDS